MQRQPALLASLAFGLLVVAVGGGCSFGESGVAPPTNRIFLPAGLVADPGGKFLFVVNSNSDLRFNAGTVVAVDLQAVCDRQPDRNLPGCPAPTQPAQPSSAGPYPICTKTTFSRTENVGGDYCCLDSVDSNLVNCNEPQFIPSDATIEIGSFGGAAQLQSFAAADGTALPVRRLFVAVRAEPSITYADITVQDDGSGRIRASLRCTGPHGPDAPAQPQNAFCDDNWRIRRPGGASPGELVLPEEPYVLSLDPASQSLFVGHLTVAANNQTLGGGVSSLDICDPQVEPWRQSPDSTLDPVSYQPVHFAGLAHHAFLPTTLFQAVAGLSSGNGAARVYAAARYSTAVSAMVFQHAVPTTCDPAAPRDLTLIPGEQFFAPALSPNGIDVRGIVFEGNRAFVLHRNDTNTMANAAAIEVLDRTPLADGTPSNTPIDVLQVCSGPAVMQKAPDAARRNRLFVTCYDDGRVYVVDTHALAVTAKIDVGAGPTSLVFSNDGTVGYVASFADSHVSLIDLRPGSRTENRVLLRIGLPHGYGE